MDTSERSNSISGKPLRLLVVDDDEVTQRLLLEVFSKVASEVRVASSVSQALIEVERLDPQVVLSDIRMNGQSGHDLLKELRRRNPRAVVILMTGFGHMEGAVEAIREGAFDYISKPFRIDALKSIVTRAFQHAVASAAAPTASRTKETTDSNERAFIGKSERIVEVYKNIARAALSQSNILILGESGTGKELAARAIHANSPRKNKTFTAVNCGALTETLLETELFGHVKGAFTGATSDKRGLFEEADDGTLFLDEIGDISGSLQVKLLRAIQEGEVRRIGSNETRKVDVRIVSATHRDLESMVRTGKFREDLFYRLKVIAIEIPPLRERKEDMPELIDHFLTRFSARAKKKISHVDNEAMRGLKQYRWPGNIRELEHAVEHAVAMAQGEILFPENFPQEVFRPVPADLAESAASTEGLGLDELEKRHIIQTLKEMGYNKSKTAEKLGIDRATLYRKASRYGIDLTGKS